MIPVVMPKKAVKVVSGSPAACDSSALVIGLTYDILYCDYLLNYNYSWPKLIKLKFYLHTNN